MIKCIIFCLSISISTVCLNVLFLPKWTILWLKMVSFISIWNPCSLLQAYNLTIPILYIYQQSLIKILLHAEIADTLSKTRNMSYLVLCFMYFMCVFNVLYVFKEHFLEYYFSYSFLLCCILPGTY